VLLQDRARRGVVLGRQLPAGNLARRNGNDPIHRQLPDNSIFTFIAFSDGKPASTPAFAGAGFFGIML
jgi:hypothetical protein